MYTVFLKPVVVNDFVVKRLYVVARSNRLRSVEWGLRVSLRTRYRSVISDHPESEDRIFRELIFVPRASRDAALVRTKDCHQISCETGQVRSVNFSYDKDDRWR